MWLRNVLFSMLLCYTLFSSAKCSCRGTSCRVNNGRISSLGSGPVTKIFSIPPAVWIYTPAIIEVSPSVFHISGWKIHFSTVHRLLSKKTQRKFPLTQTTNASPRMWQLVIKADTVYVDQSLNFQGLKKLTLKARELISIGKTLTLQAPYVCQTIKESSCSNLGKARNMMNGKNGRNGLASPAVEIYVYELQGNLKIMSKGSNGNVGEDGGDGNPGLDNTVPIPPLTDRALCHPRNDWWNGDYSCSHNGYIKGLIGLQGGNGENGRRAGLSGNGGNAGSVTLYTAKMSGYVYLKQSPGLGGAAPKHGRGGKAGKGGTGGCSIFCWTVKKCPFTCHHACNALPTCYVRGLSGLPGTSGRDGSKLYPPTVRGKSGSTQTSDMRTSKSVQVYFQEENQLIGLIQRHAEFLFQKNDIAEAAKRFNFILSVAKESSALHRQASLNMRMISQGFDYYGHTEEYAPDLDWSYLHERVNSLMETGRAFEEAHNRVMKKIEDVYLVTGAMQSVITISLTTEDRQLENDQEELKRSKSLNVKSLRQLEKTMDNEIATIKALLPQAMKPKKLTFQNFFLPMITGLVGIAEGIHTNGPTSVLTGVMEIVDALHKKCRAPSIKKAANTLQERLNFGVLYKTINPENLDFSTMNVEAVPMIMSSKLAKNKEALLTELRCLFDNRNSYAAALLERCIKDFFHDAGTRITLIDKIINIDVQLKKLSFSRGLLAETKTMIDKVVDTAENSISMDIKMSFKDYMFSLYEEQENTIMRAIYELSKAYQFSCLWNFNALEKYSKAFSKEIITSNLGLVGISELNRILRELDGQKNVFVRFSRSSAGPASHTYYNHWNFTNVTHPDLIRGLHTDGQFSLSLELDPHNFDAAGCDSCYNGRLMALYVELRGENQSSTVPNKVYVKVSHLGDSSFLIPLKNGQKGVEVLRQTPEDVDGGHVMSFDRTNHVTSEQYETILHAKFMRQEHRFCDESETFFGRRPCKSPYATYVITVPRSDDLPCSLDPRDLVSGTNCRDLDITRFNSVNIYAKVKSWSHYPVQSNQ